METIFAANQFHPRDRLDRWYDVASHVYVGHRCSLGKGQEFHASIEVGELADIAVSYLESSPIRFVRTPRHVAVEASHHVFLCVLQRGHAIWLQDGREDEAHPGDIAMLDAQRPYELAFTQPSRLLVFKVPMRTVEQRMGPTIGLTAITVSGSDTLGGLAGGFLGLLAERLPIVQQSVATQMADHALDLAVTALLASTRGGRPTLSSAREVAVAALHAAINRNLGDANLDTELVAKSAGISVRYASRLLAEQGTSISRCVMERRLEQCRRLLADPEQAHRSITEIALSWGFSDPSHFGRRFKQAYGLSPRDYRPATAKMRD